MKPLVAIGCPYTSMANLNSALKELVGDSFAIVNTEDVTTIDSTRVYTCSSDSPHELGQFRSTFIRYPYDLIPPHSGTFELRENTEFYKTLALALKATAINSLTSTWMLRNRAFSLRSAHLYGVTVAEWIAVRKRHSQLPRAKNVVKALGNCFVAEDPARIKAELRSFVHIENDDGETAAVFPASLLSASRAASYLATVGVAFFQRDIEGRREYRGYIVGDTAFVYSRDHTDSFDKSSASYLSTDFKCGANMERGLRKLMAEFALGYLCFDFVVDQEGIETVIDINPYGSMPRYEDFPEPSLQLARIMVGGWN